MSRFPRTPVTHAEKERVIRLLVASIQRGELLTLADPGSGLIYVVGSNGAELSIDLRDTTPGLELVATGLGVLVVAPIAVNASGIYLNLAADPGLELSGGALRVKVQAPILRDSNGIGLDLADDGGLAVSGGELGVVAGDGIIVDADGVSVDPEGIPLAHDPAIDTAIGPDGQGLRVMPEHRPHAYAASALSGPAAITAASNWS